MPCNFNKYLSTINILSFILILLIFKPTFINAKDIELDKVEYEQYSFTSEVSLPKPTTNLIFPFNLFAKSLIRIKIPADWAGTNVFVSSSVPKPAAVEYGPVWAPNQSLIYFVPAYGEQTITVKGYVEYSPINIDQLTFVKNAYQTTSVDEMNEYILYTKPSEYIESDNPKIIAAAKEIKGTKTKMSDIVNATYDFVVNRIDYSTLKLGVSWPKTAVDTLDDGSGVCGDYSRLLAALLRAQGIPARIVIGHVNLGYQSSDATNLHAWVQFFIPNAGFIDIDPTWGENGKQYISDIDFDHVRLEFSLPDKDLKSIYYYPYEIFNDKPYIPLLENIKSDITFGKSRISNPDDYVDIKKLSSVIFNSDGYENKDKYALSFENDFIYSNPEFLYNLQTVTLFILFIILLVFVVKKIFKKKNKLKL